MMIFLPTPSARRATCLPWSRSPDWHYFYPRPPRGGRRQTAYQDTVEDIFLPTPSARRATLKPAIGLRYYEISTHALREEGDRSRRCR